MAEVAIPTIALGIMYIMSNKNNNVEPSNAFNDNIQEHFQTEMPQNIRKIHREAMSSYPVGQHDLNEMKSNNVKYNGSKNTSDHYFKPDNYVETNKTNEQMNNNFVSINGNTMNTQNFEHNNMVPFFGSNVTQQVGDKYDGLLDLYTGSGNNSIKKTEQAPLFKPEKNMHHIYGAPNTNDFIKERMEANITNKMSNVKPWQEIKVGPGLNKGFTSKGSGGFNSGMESRDSWKPKTVDELRTETNPKVTYGGTVLGAYSGEGRTNLGILGKVEKNRPDTYYINSPDRWFTTTGIEKAQKARSTIVLQPENRSTTSKEYFGAGSGQSEKTGIYQSGKYQKSHKKHFKSYNLGGAGTISQNRGSDKDSYEINTNSRSLTGERTQVGGVGGSIKALFAPILDIIRPTRKENVVGNARPMGNVSGTYGVQNNRIWKPSDQPKTTIKEQTVNNTYITQGFHDHGGGYTTNPNQPIYNQRDTTNCQITGNYSARPGTTNGPVYNAAYNAHLNKNKESISKVNRYNIGNQSLYNSNQHLTNLRNTATNPSQIIPNLPKRSANMSTIGQMSGKNTREVRQNYERTSSDLLSPFEKNPYTHNIGSVA
jgi:hypothetical protein